MSMLDVLKSFIKNLGNSISHRLQLRILPHTHTLSYYYKLLPPPRFCFRRCLCACPLATLRKNFRTDLHEIFNEGWQWASEQTITFSCRSRTDSPDGGTDIATLVRRALAEVCTVLVLLVMGVSE